jgi:hypothetical protein
MGRIADKGTAFRVRISHGVVDIVTGILSSRPNWLPRPSHPLASVSPLVPGGGGTLACEERGRGGADSDEGTDTLIR